MKHFKGKILILMTIICIVVGTVYFFDNNLKISYKYFNPFINDEQVSFKKRYVIPGGQTIGVELKTKGILVVGLADVVNNNKISISPAKDAGMHIGDKIVSVDNKPVSKTTDFISYVKSMGIKQYNIEIERNGSRIQLLITPVKRYDANDIIFGFWARDNIAGIGTITYIDPETRLYSAVGHGITDSDTKELIDIDYGLISKANITNIKSGKRGEPGEIIGYILKDESRLGIVRKNTPFGVVGEIDEKSMTFFSNNLVEIGSKDDVKIGPAKILACLEHDIKEYDIEIIKTYYQSKATDKSFIIKIVDRELLSLTNGIIQGMSGCPIIQNGKLIGAITHVFMNDPSKGYGIYAQWLFDENTSKKSDL